MGCVVSMAMIASPSNSQELASPGKPSQLRIADAYNARQLMPASPLAVSRDGNWVAYVVTNQSDNAPSGGTTFSDTGVSNFISFTRENQIWISATHSQLSHAITHPKGSSWGPAWSPDGKQLAFFSDRDGAVRLWTWEAQSGQIRRASDVVARPGSLEEVPEWSPDGSFILFKVLNERSTLNGKQPNQTNLAEPGTTVRILAYPPVSDGRPASAESLRMAGSESRNVSDLGMLNVSTGVLSRVSKGLSPLAYRFNPSGSEIYVLAEREVALEDVLAGQYEMRAVSVSSGQTRVVDAQIALSNDSPYVTWSPGLRKFAFVSTDSKLTVESVDDGTIFRVRLQDEGNAYPGREYQPVLFDLTGSTVFVIRNNSLQRVDYTSAAIAPITSFVGQDVVAILPLSPRDKETTVVVVTRRPSDSKMAFVAVDVGTGKQRVLLEADKVLGGVHGEYVRRTVVRTGDGEFVYAAEASDEPNDVWVASRDFSRTNRISAINPELARYKFGRSMLISWRSLDGTETKGTLMLPADFQNGRSYPLVVYPYAGSMIGTNDRNRFGGVGGGGIDNLQVLTTRGFAVLVPDCPIGGDGKPMYDVAQTVLPGVNKAVDLGIADPERLAAFGYSLGGYTVMSLLTQTHRFKAAVVQSPAPTNLADAYGELINVRSNSDQHFAVQIVEKRDLKIGGTPWDHRDRYIENSPFYYLDRVTTPILLTHGTDDWAVDVFTADELFNGLRKLGKTVTYARYANEDHALRKRANIEDFWQRILQFLDKGLNGASDHPKP